MSLFIPGTVIILTAISFDLNLIATALFIHLGYAQYQKNE
jgi:hypothetical protein